MPSICQLKSAFQKLLRPLVGGLGWFSLQVIGILPVSCKGREPGTLDQQRLVLGLVLVAIYSVLMTRGPG